MNHMATFPKEPEFHNVADVALWGTPMQIWLKLNQRAISFITFIMASQLLYRIWEWSWLQFIHLLVKWYHTSRSYFKRLLCGTLFAILSCEWQVVDRHLHSMNKQTRFCITKCRNILIFELYATVNIKIIVGAI